MTIEQTVLENGLRVVSQYMPLETATVGCWFDTGSREEHEQEAGCAHFLEHLLFKGSEDVSAEELTERFDAAGAETNAFTGKERTCYYAAPLCESFDEAVTLLAEMTIRPAFRQEEIDTERKVVIEEINMNEDEPSDVAHEAFMRSLFGPHPIALPILGTRDSIEGMSRETIRGFWQRRYGATSAVVAAAGGVEHDRVVETVGEHFSGLRRGKAGRRRLAHTVQSGVEVVERDTEQVHLYFGGQGIPADAEDTYAYTVMAQILGGGMSSRLFKTIRERRGLAYSVYMGEQRYTDTGYWYIYAGTTPTQLPEVLTLIRQELDRIAREPVSEEDLSRVKQRIRGSLARSYESTSFMMRSLGQRVLDGRSLYSAAESLERFSAVTAEDVLRVANEIVEGPFVAGATGPIDTGVLKGGAE